MSASRTARHLGISLAAVLVVCALAGVARAEDSVAVTHTSDDSADALASTLTESTPGSENTSESELNATVSSLEAGTAAEGSEADPTSSGGETTSQPIDTSSAPTESDPAVTSEASPTPSESSPPASEPLPPASEPIPPASDPLPPASDPLPPASEPIPPASEAPPLSEVTPVLTETPEVSTYADWLRRTSVVSTLFAELAPAGETLVADLGARGGPADRSPHSDATPLTPEREPAPPPQAPAPAGFGGVSGGSASGFSFAVFALLSALLVLARPGMGRLIGLSLTSPQAPLLVTRLQRPG